MEEKLVQKEVKWFLVLDNIILELLKINPTEDTIELNVKNEVLIVQKQQTF